MLPVSSQSAKNMKNSNVINPASPAVWPVLAQPLGVRPTGVLRIMVRGEGRSKADRLSANYGTLGGGK